jgi:hypothetical protein
MTPKGMAALILSGLMLSACASREEIAADVPPVENGLIR